MPNCVCSVDIEALTSAHRLPPGRFKTCETDCMLMVLVVRRDARQTSLLKPCWLVGPAAAVHGIPAIASSALSPPRAYTHMLLAAIVVCGISSLSPPNVVFLWVDDVGYGDLGFNGNNTMRTPNLDALAASGAVLTQHLVASPICTPSRAALMTGRHAVRSGMTSGDPNFYVMGVGPGGLPDQEVTVAEALRDRGYSTAMVGKWCARRPAHTRHSTRDARVCLSRVARAGPRITRRASRTTKPASPSSS